MKNDPIASGIKTIETEVQGLNALARSLDDRFGKAVSLLQKARGRAIVTGMGKSGHIARKIAATLASTGTPAQFVHPGEASHGDMGMITPDDVIIALSRGGESQELHDILAYAVRFRISLIAVTSGQESPLAKAATLVLELPQTQEACPIGLAPTTSTTMQLALGDALAVALMEARGFKAHDYKTFHPGGKLGAMLKTVGEIMRGNEALPLTAPDTPMSTAMITMTEKSLGCIGVVNPAGELVGVLTDGDLRRHMGEDLLNKRIDAVMTRDPKVIPESMMAVEALNRLNALSITSFFVVKNKKPVGLVHLHDLIRIGVI